MERRVVVVGLLVLGLAVYAAKVRAADHPAMISHAQCSGSWSLNGYQALYASPKEYAGAGVTFFSGALKAVQANIPHPTYYIPGATMGLAMCPGQHGHVVEIEVAANPQTGTRLYAVGDGR